METLISQQVNEAVNGSAPSPLRVRSMVGLIPLFAVETLESELIDRMPGFKRRMQWFIDNLPEFSQYIETETTPTSIRRTLSLVSRQRLRRVLELMLDETEFLSPNGIRSLSRFHREHPYRLEMNGAVSPSDASQCRLFRSHPIAGWSLGSSPRKRAV